MPVMLINKPLILLMHSLWHPLCSSVKLQGWIETWRTVEAAELIVCDGVSFFLTPRFIDLELVT